LNIYLWLHLKIWQFWKYYKQISFLNSNRSEILSEVKSRWCYRGLRWPFIHIQQYIAISSTKKCISLISGFKYCVIIMTIFWFSAFEGFKAIWLSNILLHEYIIPVESYSENESRVLNWISTFDCIWKYDSFENITNR
jgi:hypothetical protein